MPIHDQGYRRYTGPRLPSGRAWMVMATTGLRTVLARRTFLGLMLLAWVPFLVRAVQLYAAANLPQARFLAPDGRLFRSFLEQQELFLFFITVYVGSGLIAGDRRANALQIYLSKPLTRTEYVCGKFAILATLLLSVTWLPAMLLLAVQMAFAGSVSFLVDHLYLVPAITLFSLLQAVTIGLAMLALSSLSNSSRYVGVLYAGLLFFSQALSGVVRALTRDSRFAFLSVGQDLMQVGDLIFRLPLRFHMPVWVPIIVLGLLITASVLILARRVRGLEVVA